MGEKKKSFFIVLDCKHIAYLISIESIYKLYISMYFILKYNPRYDSKEHLRYSISSQKVMWKNSLDISYLFTGNETVVWSVELDSWSTPTLFTHDSLCKTRQNWFGWESSANTFETVSLRPKIFVYLHTNNLCCIFILLWRCERFEEFDTASYKMNKWTKCTPHLTLHNQHA